MKSKDKVIQTLLDENPWILEHEGFNTVSFGIPLGYSVEDELGLVVTMQSKKDARSMKRLFTEKLGSGHRWKQYPIYYDVTGPIQLH